MRLLLVRLANASDVLRHELEVEDVDALADALRRGGSRNHGMIAVQMPLDHDHEARGRLQNRSSVGSQAGPGFTGICVSPVGHLGRIPRLCRADGRLTAGCQHPEYLWTPRPQLRSAAVMVKAKLVLQGGRSHDVAPVRSQTCSRDCGGKPGHRHQAPHLTVGKNLISSVRTLSPLV